MNISKTIKILIGVLAIIIMAIVAVGGWLSFKREEKRIEEKKIGKRLEIKGKLETIQLASFSLFNKECLDRDLKVGNYYLTGLCKTPPLAASLLEIIGEEIEVKGETKEMKADIPSEKDSKILITKTFEVIEVEEIVPPQIIRIITNTTVYKPGEKISIHLKHYLKKSVFSYFNTEKPTCAINSIKKKNGEWKEVSISGSKPPDCAQILPKEIKPYHLSGEFGMFEWQPPELDSGEYRLKIIYKLEGEEEWKEVYSNEFAIIPGPKISKPTTETKCELKRGYQDYRDPRQKAVILEIGFNNYTNFFLKKTTIEYTRIVQYGSLSYPHPMKYLEKNRPFVLKTKAQDGKILSTYEIDPYAGMWIMREMCPDCPPPPPPEFAKEGEFSLWIPLPPFVPEEGYVPPEGGIGKIKTIRFIEISEREKLPDWAIEQGKTFPGYKPNQLLLDINLSECLEKFCGEMAYQDDPYCIGEYPLPPIIKGKVTDHQGNPVEHVMIEILWAPPGEPITYKSTSPATLYTDKNGDYILDTFYSGYEDESGLKEGTYSFSFRPPRRLNLKGEYDKRITLKKGETAILNITLKQCGSIVGKVTDSFGNPITETPGYEQGGGYEIGFETPRYAILNEKEAKEAGQEPGTFMIPYLEPKEYLIGAYVKIQGKVIELPPKKVKVELGKTAIVNFVVEK